MNEATGRFVAYLGDDDFWLPCHLAILNELLSEADFGHTLHIGLDEQGKLFALAADLECQGFRNRMLTERFNRFDFTFGGHTLEAYRRIPTGWHTVPLGEFPWGDLYIWRQFLAEPWCRVRSLMIPTAICTQTHRRPYLSNRERADELSHWRGESIKPHFREMLWREVASTFARDLIRHEIGAQSLQAEIAKQSKIRQELTETTQSLQSEIAEQSKIRQELEGRISELESNWAETTRSLCDLSLKLSVVRKSRLLKAGRLLRRLTGRPIPY